MTIGNLFGSGGESNSLYGTLLTSGGSIPAASSFIYFEWFIFKASASQPTSPSGGSWDFLTNTGTPPTGWTSNITGIPSDNLWFSIAFVDSRNPLNVNWSTPGLISATAPAYPIASNVSYTPSSWIGSINVQAALNEVATDISATDGVSGSNLVGYKPSGTGTVATTVQSKLRQYVSVKDFGATGNGSTDDTAAINTAATYARSNNVGLAIPSGTYFVSSSLNFSDIYVCGMGNTSKIQSSSAQFDVVTTTGNSTFENFYIDGAWNGSTAGQTGNGISISGGSASTFAYDVYIKNVKLQNCKQSAIYILNGGYTSIENCKSNASGLHGLYLNGTSAAYSTSTVRACGYSAFSDCPNGYGVLFNECIECTIDSIVSENTKGFLINGNDNRCINILNCYQENTSTGYFLTLGGSGSGLVVQGCIGIGLTIVNPGVSANWPGSNSFLGNAISSTSLGGNGRITNANSGEVVISSTGSFTSVSISLSPGSYLLLGTFQTLNSSSATLTKTGIFLTADVTASGYQNGTNAFTFQSAVDLLDYNPGTTADVRLNASTVVQVTTTQTYYLRAYVALSAGSIATQGYITATQLF